MFALENAKELEILWRAGGWGPGDDVKSGTIVLNRQLHEFVLCRLIWISAACTEVKERDMPRVEFFGFRDRSDDVLRGVDRGDRYSEACDSREDAVLSLNNILHDTVLGIPRTDAVCVSRFFQQGNILPVLRTRFTLSICI